MPDRFVAHFNIRQKYVGKGKPILTPELALKRAAARGHYLDVIGLLPYVHNIAEAGGSSDRSALHWAAIYGHEIIFRLLEQNGISANVEDAAHMTALEYLKKTRPEALKDRDNNLQFFSSPFQSLFHQTVLQFLNYNDIFYALMTCRYNYTQSLFIRIYRAAKFTLGEDIKYYFNISTYAQINQANNPLGLTAPHRERWTVNKLELTIDLDAHPYSGSSSYSNPYGIIIIERHLTNEAAVKLLSHSNLASYILSVKGLKLFQQGIFTEVFVLQLLQDRSQPLWFDALLKFGFNELMNNTITLDNVWEVRNELNQLIQSYGNPGSIAEALTLVANGTHLIPPNYHSILDDIMNDPYQRRP